MNKARRPHLFWGSASPLASLIGGGLLIMASGRLAFALVCAGALLWVYGLSALAAFSGRKFFPNRGKTLVFVFLSAFTGALYLLILWFVNAILAMENFFIVSLVPLVCAGSGMFERAGSQKIREAVFRALGEAAVLGGCIIALSLIREPLGCPFLSLPGGVQGIVKIFPAGEEGFLPIRAIAGSTGALLLLGYGISIYRYFRERCGYTKPEENV